MPGEEPKTTDTGTAAGTGGTTTTEEPKPAVTFKTREEFHREVDRKSKSAAEKAREEARAEIYGKLGIESDDDLPQLTEQIKATQKTVTEAEKTKSQLEKLSKEHQKAIARGDALQARVKAIAKRDALAPFAGKVADMEIFGLLAERALEVDDDGVVTVKDGGKVDDWVEATLKAKPILRTPEAKQGAGTTETEPRKKDGAAAGGTETSTTTANGTGTKPLSFGEKMVADLIRDGKLPAISKGP